TKLRPDHDLAWVEAGLPGIQRALAKRELAAMGNRLVALAMLAQDRQARGMLMAEQAEGHDAARADDEAVLVQPRLAVAAEAEGVDAHRLYHGAEAAHGGAVTVEHGAPAGQQRDIGGGAAHVGDEDILLAREVTRAHDAGRGTREDRLHRAFHGDGSFDQR